MYDKLSSREREAMLKNDKYPRSAKYDVDWIWKNQLGSHCLWLAEALTNLMDLRPGLRVLDLGCGKVLGSVFLAKEFGCQVWAVVVGRKPHRQPGAGGRGGCGGPGFSASRRRPDSPVRRGLL